MRQKTAFLSLPCLEKTLSFELPHLKLLGQLAKNDDARSATHFGSFKRRGRKGDPFRDRGDDHTLETQARFLRQHQFCRCKNRRRMSKTLFWCFFWGGAWHRLVFPPPFSCLVFEAAAVIWYIQRAISVWA